MRKPGGRVTIVFPESGTRERDTFTCNHCQAIVTEEPGQVLEDMGSQCKGCMGLICLVCSGRRAAGETCKPWEKRLEEIEAHGRFIKSMQEWG